MAEKQSAKQNAQDGGAAEVQAKADEINEKGYLGTLTDETPFENYTLGGQNAGKPTPETERGK